MRKSDPIQGILFNVSHVTPVHLHAKAMQRASTKQSSKQTKFFLTAPVSKTDTHRISRRAKSIALEPLTKTTPRPIAIYNKLRKR